MADSLAFHMPPAGNPTFDNIPAGILPVNNPAHGPPIGHVGDWFPRRTDSQQIVKEGIAGIIFDLSWCSVMAEVIKETIPFSGNGIMDMSHHMLFSFLCAYGLDHYLAWAVTFEVIGLRRDAIATEDAQREARAATMKAQHTNLRVEQRINNLKIALQQQTIRAEMKEQEDVSFHGFLGWDHAVRLVAVFSRHGWCRTHKVVVLALGVMLVAVALTQH
ncbi:hypothetical protein GE09DRAFT_1050677 [Coniochaeta sp. 2T2.1]|nr:hypothetical protein GE09DRAFT_1050677 [Coniochaeta sp. 2T2.1]